MSKTSATHEHKSSEKTAATLAINQTLASDVKQEEQQTSTTTAATTTTVPGFKKISSNFTSFIDDLLQVNALDDTTKAPLVLSTTQIATTIKSTSSSAPIKSIINDDDFIKKHLKATSTSTTFSKSSSHQKEQPPALPQPVLQKKQQMEIFSKPTNPTMNGLLKLAGCNIYGQMYDVGHVIPELSNPCYECKCLPDIGVGCMPLC
jgi:hypothetical protein